MEGPLESHFPLLPGTCSPTSASFRKDPRGRRRKPSLLASPGFGVGLFSWFQTPSPGGLQPPLPPTWGPHSLRAQKEPHGAARAQNVPCDLGNAAPSGENSYTGQTGAFCRMARLGPWPPTPRCLWSQHRLSAPPQPSRPPPRGGPRATRPRGACVRSTWAQEDGEGGGAGRWAGKGVRLTRESVIRFVGHGRE